LPKKRPVTAEAWNEYCKDQPFLRNSECSGCGQVYKNWSGSTPCCGAIAYIVEEQTLPNSEDKESISEK
jgi:predicted ATP-dependent serine protease